MSLAVAKIREFVKLNSYFEETKNSEDSDEDNSSVTFHTDQMYNIEDMSPGKEDIKAALELRDKLTEKFNNISVETSTLNEFVLLEVRIV